MTTRTGRVWLGVMVAMFFAGAQAQDPAQAPDSQPADVYPTVAIDSPAAPFILTNQYAQAQGATAEWRKMEGVALDAANGRLYIAMSEIGKGMSDGEGDIQLEENPCGIVYTAELSDTFDIGALQPLVVGGPFDETAVENECSLEGISNPDNVAVDARGRVWIGEDSGYHLNNALWVYDPATQELTRFATVPLGAEVTGLHVSAAGTLFMNIQHPDATNLYPFNRGTVGVVTGFNANTDDFTELAVPQGDAQKQAQVAAGEYSVIGRVGDAIPSAPGGPSFGEINAVQTGEHLFFCNDPDGNMFLPTSESGNEGYLYTNFECRPGGVSKLYIRQADDGTWNVIEGEQVDFAGVNGTMTNCFASVTPWNTGLSGEEYPAERSEDWTDNAVTMREYLGKAANPFDYGYVIELTPGEGVGSEVVKHYAMGRISVENALVMPDGKTVYYGNDGTDRVLHKFIADEPGNLDAGTLYAAKAAQQDDGSFALTWLELGHSTSEEVYAAIRELDGQITLAGQDR